MWIQGTNSICPPPFGNSFCVCVCSVCIFLLVQTKSAKVENRILHILYMNGVCIFFAAFFILILAYSNCSCSYGGPIMVSGVNVCVPFVVGSKHQNPTNIKEGMLALFNRSRLQIAATLSVSVCVCEPAEHQRCKMRKKEKLVNKSRNQKQNQTESPTAE